MCSKFASSMAQTYVASTLGSMLSQVAMRGINGASTPANFNDTLLNGLQTGTFFVAYPISLNLISKCCPSFKKANEDPKGNKILVYVAGGAGAAAIVTAINFPLSRIQLSLNSKEVKKATLKDVFGHYFDQVGASIGFAATMGTVAPLVPVPKDTFGQWARNHLLVHTANLGGKICSYPVHKIHHGSTLTGMIGGYLANAGGVMITGDSTNYFKDVLKFLVE